MLLGLVAAAMLATLLQLIALRARRAGAFAFGPDGTIHLRCWVVVEAPVATPFAALRATTLLALPAPARWPEPLRFVGEMRMMAPGARARRPAPARAMVYASAERFRSAEARIFIRDDALMYAAPRQPGWDPHCRAPPPFRRTPAAAPPLH